MEILSRVPVSPIYGIGIRRGTNNGVPRLVRDRIDTLHP